MKLVALTLPVLALAACAKTPDPPNCSRRPEGFYTWRDIPVGIDGYRGNTIRVTDKTIFWNGVDLGGAEDVSATTVLDQYLRTAAQMQPVPFSAITFEKGVACSRVKAVRASMEKNLSCRANYGKCLQGAPPEPHDGRHSTQSRPMSR